MPPIPVTEFARRLCQRAHPFVHQTGQPVPCANHIRQSQNLWFLLEPEGPGNETFELIASLREEAHGPRLVLTQTDGGITVTEKRLDPIEVAP